MQENLNMTKQMSSTHRSRTAPICVATLIGGAGLALVTIRIRTARAQLRD